MLRLLNFILFLLTFKLVLASLLLLLPLLLLPRRINVRLAAFDQRDRLHRKLLVGRREKKSRLGLSVGMVAEGSRAFCLLGRRSLALLLIHQLVLHRQAQIFADQLEHLTAELVLAGALPAEGRLREEFYRMELAIVLHEVQHSFLNFFGVNVDLLAGLLLTGR